MVDRSLIQHSLALFSSAVLCYCRVIHNLLLPNPNPLVLKIEGLIIPILVRMRKEEDYVLRILIYCRRGGERGFRVRREGGEE